MSQFGMDHDAILIFKNGLFFKPKGLTKKFNCFYSIVLPQCGNNGC